MTDTADILVVDAATPATPVVRINRPERRNALNTAVLLRLADVLDAFDTDPVVRCTVITGDSVAFAAGADIDEVAVLTPRTALEDPRVGAWSRIRQVRKPLIAAVEGYCLGGGLELALSCDTVVVGAGAKLGLPEVKIGVMPGAGGTQILPRMIGKAMAMRMALSGAFISAPEALTSGLAAELTEEGGALAAALKLAGQIAGNAPQAVMAAKASVLAAFTTGLEDGLKFERARFAVLQATDDKAEGIAAFRDKRKAEFRGR